MKRITRKEFEALKGTLWGRSPQGYGEFSNTMERHWDRIQEVQSSEPMSVESIEVVIKQVMVDNDSHYLTWPDVLKAREIAKAIQPLTVQQGFTPDWSKAPEWTGGVIVQWSNDMLSPMDKCFCHFIPRPIPKMRPKTPHEKLTDLMAHGTSATRITWMEVARATTLEGKTLDDLLADRGIATEVQE